MPVPVPTDENSPSMAGQPGLHAHAQRSGAGPSERSKSSGEPQEHDRSAAHGDVPRDPPMSPAEPHEDETSAPHDDIESDHGLPDVTSELSQALPAKVDAALPRPSQGMSTNLLTVTEMIETEFDDVMARLFFPDRCRVAQTRAWHWYLTGMLDSVL